MESCNVISTGSIEYAAEHLGTRLIVMLGHTKCGAIYDIEDGHVDFLES